jgi:hypothetical protein
MNRGAAASYGEPFFSRYLTGISSNRAADVLENFELVKLAVRTGFERNASPALSNPRMEESLSVEVFSRSLLDSIAFQIQQAVDQRTMGDLAERWKRFVLDASAAWDADALDSTVEPLFEALIKLGPSAIDLRGLREEQVNGMHLAVVLRATFTVRHQTLGWQDALKVAESALRKQGCSPQEALMGLL